MSNQNVINLDLLEPEAIKQLHGNLGRQLEAMGQARVSARNSGYSENHKIWHVDSFWSSYSKNKVEKLKT